MKKPVIITLTALLAFLFLYALIGWFQGSIRLSQEVVFGPLSVRFYGLILFAAIFSAYLASRSRAHFFGLTQASFDDFAFGLLIFGILGARIYFVVLESGYYLANPKEIYMIWKGGLSIFGAILGGFMFTLGYSYIRKLEFKSLIDLTALSLPLGQAIGRWGNFVNYEAFGLPTNVYWKMYIPEMFRPPEYFQEEFFHPVFLYESLFLFALFFVLWKLRKFLKKGVLAFLYLGSYSLIRFFLEPIRLDSVYFAGFRVDQLTALILLLVSGIFIISWQLKGVRKEVPQGE
jgi:phosphatidylglycerol---prolipoprotein diacylglyceryl transferase